jgi:geranylgeranyl pyrophosphate synthase
MNALAMRLLRRNLELVDAEVVARIFEDVDHLLLESLEGQAMELGWIRDRACDIGTDDYLRLVLKKTAWYSFIHPMRIGALVAGGEAAGDLDRFHRLGFLLGAAFQIQDDVLNLVGDGTRYGKEIGGDLWEGKRTLVLSHAFTHATVADRARLEDFLSRPGQPRLDREQADVYDLLGRTGSIAWARRAGSELARAAAGELAAAFAGAREGPDLNFVRSLVAYVVNRDL